MSIRICTVAMLLLTVSITWADSNDPATQPTSQPAAVSNLPAPKTIVDRMRESKPEPVELADLNGLPTTEPDKVAAAAIGDAPATQPATQPTLTTNLPSPSELVNRMRQARRGARITGGSSAAKIKDIPPRVAYFDVGKSITEKPSDFSLFGDGDEATTLRSLLTRIRQAQDDKSVRGVLITLGESGLNISQAQEIRDALLSLRKSGKRTFVYADSFDTDTYTLASGATDVCMLPGGDVELPGVGLETMFAKGLLDKIGVKADYVQIGEFKGADEEYTRTEPSEELRGQLDKLVDALYGQVVAGISLNRNLSQEEVKRLIDEALIPAQEAKERGLVDHLVDPDGLRELMAGELGGKVDLLADYGKAPKETVDLSSPFAILSLLNKKPETSNRTAVALIYAQGVIVDGDGGGGLFSQGGNIGSKDIREAMRIAFRDDKIKAVVIRIDSPGGSALASEAMWQAVRRVEKTKPVIISVGGMAASGGYYLASSGDYIFADPTAIVGSIGVVGGKFVLKDLYEKLGVSTAMFSRGKNANLFNSSEPWTDQQRRMVTNWMRETYDQFTQRVMTTRKGKIKDIDQVARGRIFVAKDAKELGMVDEIGGIEDAINYAAGQVKLQPGQYDVRVIPPPKTLADFFGGGSDAAMPFKPNITISPESLLNAIPASTRRLMLQELQSLELFQDRPVVLMSPVLISVR